MKVRVGIVTRNRAALLPRALDSVLAQDYPDTEIVVYDIASTDDTPALRARYPSVIWWRMEERADMISPKNRLMHETDADLFFSLDDDAWFLARNQLSTGVRLLQEHPQAAVLGFDIRLPGMSSASTPPIVHPHHLFVACGALLRLDAVRAVGFYAYSPAVYGGGEESDLCLRLLDAGYEVLRLEGVPVWHEWSPLGRNASEQRISSVASTLAYTLIRCPLLLLPLVWPWRTAQFLRYALSNGRISEFLAGIRVFLLALPGSLKTREPVSMRSFLEYRRRTRQVASR